MAVEAADFESIALTVLRQIQATEGVQHTYTAPVLPLDTLGIYAGGPGMPPMPMHRPGPACYVHIRAAAGPGSVAGVVQALGAMDDVAGVARTGTRVLRTNEENLIRLGQLSEPTLALLDTYAPEYPCLFKGIDRYSHNLGEIFKGDIANS